MLCLEHLLFSTPAWHGRQSSLAHFLPVQGSDLTRINFCELPLLSTIFILNPVMPASTFSYSLSLLAYTPTRVCSTKRTDVRGALFPISLLVMDFSSSSTYTKAQFSCLLFGEVNSHVDCGGSFSPVSPSSPSSSSASLFFSLNQLDLAKSFFLFLFYTAPSTALLCSFCPVLSALLSDAS